MVKLIVDTTCGDHFDVSTLGNGSKEVAKVLMAGHIFDLDTLAGIILKILTSCFSNFGPGMCDGAIKVTKFIRLDKSMEFAMHLVIITRQWTWL